MSLWYGWIRNDHVVANFCWV